MLNGDAHYPSVKVRIELRIRPADLVFKDESARRIPQVALTCSNGAVALTRLASAAPYDLMITDNNLPHVDGLEVVRYARQLQHRAGLPVVMFSGSDCGKAAYKAGVDVFLKKPEDIGRLIETIRGLVQRRRGEGDALP
jgi:CheY-like chemotaxis protein